MKVFWDERGGADPLFAEITIAEASDNRGCSRCGRGGAVALFDNSFDEYTKIALCDICLHMLLTEVSRS